MSVIEKPTDEERKIKTIKILDFTDIEESEMTLSDFIKLINEKVAMAVQEEFLNSVRVHAEEECGECDCWTHVYISYKRPETDAEVKSRVAQRLAYATDFINQERREYDRLKAKFG
jgi:hypothetical protein